MKILSALRHATWPATLVAAIAAVALLAVPAHAEESTRTVTGQAVLGEPSAARAGTRDFPNLPQRCFTSGSESAPAPKACRITRFDKSRPTLVLWGDSHAQQYLPPVRKAVKGRGVNLVAFVSGGCPPAWVPRQSAGYPNCEAKNRAALDWIQKHRSAGERVTVLLSSSWSRWRELYRKVRSDERADREPRFDEAIVRVIKLSHDGTPPLFRALGRIGVRVDLVGISGGYPPNGKPACADGEEPYRCPLPRADVIIDEVPTEKFLARQSDKLTGPSRFIDTSGAYCGSRRCFGTVNDIPTFYDSAHLSKTLTKTMTPYFGQTAKRAAGR